MPYSLTVSRYLSGAGIIAERSDSYKRVWCVTWCYCAAFCPTNLVERYCSQRLIAMIRVKETPVVSMREAHTWSAFDASFHEDAAVIRNLGDAAARQ